MALFIDAQDQRLVRRIEVEPDHVLHLGGEVLVARDLECRPGLRPCARQILRLESHSNVEVVIRVAALIGPRRRPRYPIVVSSPALRDPIPVRTPRLPPITRPDTRASGEKERAALTEELQAEFHKEGEGVTGASPVAIPYAEAEAVSG